MNAAERAEREDCVECERPTFGRVVRSPLDIVTWLAEVTVAEQREYETQPMCRACREESTHDDLHAVLVSDESDATCRVCR